MVLLLQIISGLWIGSLIGKKWQSYKNRSSLAKSIMKEKDYSKLAKTKRMMDELRQKQEKEDAINRIKELEDELKRERERMEKEGQTWTSPSFSMTPKEMSDNIYKFTKRKKA